MTQLTSRTRRGVQAGAVAMEARPGTVAANSPDALQRRMRMAPTPRPTMRRRIQKMTRTIPPTVPGPVNRQTIRTVGTIPVDTAPAVTARQIPIPTTKIQQVTDRQVTDLAATDRASDRPAMTVAMADRTARNPVRDTVAVATRRPIPRAPATGA